MKYLKGKNNLIREALNLIRKGRGNQFLTSDWFSHAGVLPKNAKSYINFFKKNSELSRALPLRNGKNLKFYKKISIPILTVIGDQKEYTIIPIKKALNLLKEENKLTKCYQIKNCNHDFEGKEIQLSKIITSFLNKI